MSLPTSIIFCGNMGLLAVNRRQYNKILAASWEKIYSIADRKSTRLNSSHANISYAVFCLKKKKTKTNKLYHQLAYMHHTT